MEGGKTPLSKKENEHSTSFFHIFEAKILYSHQVAAYLEYDT